MCQVATTVFNAAYEAGLKITERTNHALYISHYPQGRDATVNYPDVDLKFVNDTGQWLLLRTWVGPSSLTVATEVFDDRQATGAVTGAVVPSAWTASALNWLEAPTLGGVPTTINDLTSSGAEGEPPHAAIVSVARINNSRTDPP